MEDLNPPATLAMPFANNGTKNDIPVEPTGTNKASLTEGFPLLTSTPSDQGGIPPARADFNGVMNLNSQFYFAFQNGWLPTFNPSVSQAIGGYPLGAKLWYVDAQGGVNMLISLKGNNTDNFITNPSVIGTSWRPILVTQDYVVQNLALKVNKAGDTMSGQLIMANGSNGIRFNGATADNYYYVKPGSGGLIEGDGTNEYRILTTDDINKDISAPVYTLPNYNALIQVTLPYTVQSNGYILIDPVDSTYSISINEQNIFTNYDLGSSINSQTGYLWVKKGDSVTSTGGQNLKFMPAIQVPFSS